MVEEELVVHVADNEPIRLVATVKGGNVEHAAGLVLLELVRLRLRAALPPVVRGRAVPPLPLDSQLAQLVCLRQRHAELRKSIVGPRVL